MYHMMRGGVNPSVFTILPMLGKHPDEYPRFRDCFTGDQERNLDDKIVILTRTGGGNRGSYHEQNQEMQNMPTYEQDYDADFDSTYAVFVFGIPEKFKKDYELVTTARIAETSEEYQKTLYEVFPKLKEQWDELFNG